MKTNRWDFLLSCLAALLLVFGLTGDGVAKDHEEMLKVGKKSEVTLRTDTHVGDQMLVAGRYRVQHRAEGEQHFVKFTRLDGVPRTEIDVKCRVEPSEREVEYTSLYTNTVNGMSHLTRIAVKGETASHWLSPSSH